MTTTSERYAKFPCPTVHDLYLAQDSHVGIFNRRNTQSIMMDKNQNLGIKTQLNTQ